MTNSRTAAARSNNRRRPTTIATFTALAAVMLLPACASGAVDDGATADTVNDAAMAAFYDQTLGWSACGDEFATSDREAEILAGSPAECAFLTVPFDYDEPSGSTASIAVSRITASGEATGSLVFNPGGPGGSGVFGPLALTIGLGDSRIAEKFDLVGFDPRGVGATTPAADCYSADGTTRGDELFPLAANRPEFTEEDTLAIFERCASGSGGGEVLVQMGTRTTAMDMDVLRAALGDEQLTFLGQSYGTRLGAVYAEQFPQRVRAMILDGAFDPTLGTVDRFATTYTGFQRSFDAMVSTCTQDPQCPLGTDPAIATEAFQQIMQPLDDTPVPALDTEMDFDSALGAVILGLYSATNWPTIIAGIAEVQQGRGDILLQLTLDVTTGTDDPETAVNGNLSEALFAINCMDEQRLSSNEIARLHELTYQSAPMMDRGEVGVAREACEHWPAEPTLGFPYAQDVEGLPETLVVSFTDDATTPYTGATALAGALGSSLLTLEGTEHTIVSAGTNPCVDDIAADYLIDLQLPQEMPDCTA